jgi:hypothetical protein
MKRAALAVAVVLVAGTLGCGSTRMVTKTVTVSGEATIPPRQLLFYGHVKTLRRARNGFELRVDPALWLGGMTAQRAAVEDGALPPGEPVPNDYYIRDEGHRLLTYRVPANARVTVLTYASGIRGKRISVAEYAELLAGRNPRHLRLFEPKAGFWIRVATDTVRSIVQQYQP